MMDFSYISSHQLSDVNELPERCYMPEGIQIPTLAIFNKHISSSISMLFELEAKRLRRSMDPSNNDPGLLLVSHYLQERGLYETARTLERESQVIFNLDYFVTQILEGMFDTGEEYLSAFTKASDNWMSAKSIYLVKQLKLLEALYDGCRAYAQSIVEREFSQFETVNPQVIEEARKLVEMRDPRSHPMLQNFHRQNMRMRVVEEVKGIIRTNPVFSGKLEYPKFQATLQRLINMVDVTNGPNGRVISLFTNRYTKIGRNDSGNDSGSGNGN